MPPDASKLRHRRHDDRDENESEDTAVAPTERICKVADLQGDEICIEGVIYDISDFDHPGGEQIKIMSGNDVTIQYKMIHPYHTSHHLEKMKRVGKVTDYTTE